MPGERGQPTSETMEGRHNCCAAPARSLLIIKCPVMLHPGHVHVRVKSQEVVVATRGVAQKTPLFKVSYMCRLVVELWSTYSS